MSVVKDVVIVDYGTCSCKSIQNMVDRLGYKSRITRFPEDIEAAEKIILPGIGAFDQGIKNLAELNLRESLNYSVLGRAVPTLGICLGAQLMTRKSEEGRNAGLGWVNAKTIKFDLEGDREAEVLTHVGWAETRCNDISLFAGMGSLQRFYYVHSYHFDLGEEEQEICSAVHGYEFPAGFSHENIIGVQFHPEKSHRFGMNLMANFLERY